jgi:hypothetical protein
MLVLRYFVFAGGALLALLLACTAMLPKPPATGDTMASASDVPPIRIHSDRKLPERVVLDTNAVMPVAPKIAQVTPPQAPLAAEAAAKAREAFAEGKVEAEPKQVVAQVKKPEMRPVKRRVARARVPDPYYREPYSQSYAYQPYAYQRYGYPRYAPPRGMMVAQQPRFGFFW